MHESCSIFHKLAHDARHFVSLLFLGSEKSEADAFIEAQGLPLKVSSRQKPQSLNVPDVVTLVLNHQQEHPARRRQQQVCQHGLIIQSQWQARLEQVHVDAESSSSSLHITGTDASSSSSSSITGSVAPLVARGLITIIVEMIWCR